MFYSKKKFEKLVHLVGFIIRNLQEGIVYNIASSINQGWDLQIVTHSTASSAIMQ
jgi:hypothetical protein